MLLRAHDFFQKEVNKVSKRPLPFEAVAQSGTVYCAYSYNYPNAKKTSTVCGR
jgi:hypothetical protein